MKWRKYWGPEDIKVINLANSGKTDGDKLQFRPL